MTKLEQIIMLLVSLIVSTGIFVTLAHLTNDNIFTAIAMLALVFLALTLMCVSIYRINR